MGIAEWLVPTALTGSGTVAAAGIVIHERAKEAVRQAEQARQERGGSGRGERDQ